MRTRILSVFLVLACFSGVAAAQVDDKVDLQYFEPALGPGTFLTVAGAQVMTPKQMQAGMAVTYLTEPLVVYNVSGTRSTLGSTRSTVVRSILAGQIGGSYGLRENLQVGVALPLIFSMAGDGLNPATGEEAAEDLAVRGLGTLRLEAAYRFLDQGALAAAVIPVVTVPTGFGIGTESSYLGDSIPSFRPRAAVEFTSGKVRAAANLGVILRKPREIYSSEVGQQLTYGVAAAYQVGEKVGVVGELFGRKGFSADVDESPLEVDAALRVKISPALALLAGGGAGVVKGIGSPGMRFFGGLNWAPDYRDTDTDGVPNMQDRCPFQAEDRDGFNDGDGCPDLDNDLDEIPDELDRCPNDVEDMDGFDDDDGCPDLDNDKDGLLDDKDRCPTFAEDGKPPFVDDGCPADKTDTDADGVFDAFDKCPEDNEDADGFEDDDGCPDNDNDKDGVDDGGDKCPTSAEDKDGFEDEDGCPDPDNDLDGILDKQDRCPLERETINGKSDDDGCPDTGGKVRAWMEGDNVLLAERLAFSGSRFKTEAKDALDQVAGVMRGEPGALKWRLVIADKDEAKAKERAAAVKGYLVGQGVDAARLEAVGVAGSDPWTLSVTERDPKVKLPATTPPPGGEPDIDIEGGGAEIEIN